LISRSRNRPPIYRIGPFRETESQELAPFLVESELSKGGCPGF